ncbi:sulfotransferase [Planktothrix paucivesiculata]|uniref:Chromosome segregation ATPase-like protein n=1 Tax=Planktothrix paucivesiculata PCC 9631 TaxID=671071 RepID=A0A7Z9DUX7_9CYAN|nr:sulfotransferase [Planktothrix paucivesiculata]VXD11502.1 Chromosome segregation ATPase-like protein [Planktothrix paucivesiculata PCC 9631]
MQKSNTEQTVFIITGMHRSGTSLTASILQSAGVHIGRNLLGADHVNIKGHFENIDFYQFHINILDSQGVSGAGWTLQDNLEIKEEFVDRAKQLIEQNALSSIWGWKEPRTTLFLEFWAKLLPEARFLLIYRSPWEVADSLYRRGDEIFQSQPELAIKYWQHYNQKILDFYNQEQHRCLLTNLKTIVQYQTAYIDTINHKFNVNLSHPAPTAYDPSLLRTEISSNSQRPTLIDHYFPEAIELYQELEGRGWHPEQTPDFSWQELLKPTLYKTWAFQEWVNLRQLEIENKSLKSQLQEEQVGLEEVKVIQAESEQTKTQLKTAESLLEQSQSQLQETESVLQQSQTQLTKTESILQKSHHQLNQTRTELETAKTQFSQSQFDVMRYQSQLHQTQEELEYYELHRQEWEDAQSQLDQVEVSLSQLTTQLQQTQKREERFQIQLHQTLEELEQTKTQLQHDQDNFQETSNQVKQLKRDLKRSTSQLYQVQSEFDVSHSQLQQSESQLQQTQTELTEIKSQFQESNRDLKQKQAQVNQLQTELKRSQSQMYQLQIELAQSQLQIQQIQERQQLEQSLSNDPKKHTEMDYNLLIWDAWNAYRNGKLSQMKAHLQKALKLTTASPSEIILTWLESFSKLSLAQGMELDSESLTNSEEWQQLVRQMTRKKGVTLTEKFHDPSKTQEVEVEAVETAATQAKTADAG